LEGHRQSKTILIKSGKKLNIQSLNDWYNISTTQVKKYGGAGLFSQYGSFTNALKAIYPNHIWKPWSVTRPHNFVRGKMTFSKDQHLLSQLVTKLFKNCSIELNYQFHSKTHRPMELDIFIPEYSLALEYNGEYHFKQVPVHGDVEMIKKRDLHKEIMCTENGYTLIVIPFWWDKTIESVAQTIHLARPDIIIPDSYLQGVPIPNKMTTVPQEKKRYFPKNCALIQDQEI